MSGVFKAIGKAFKAVVKVVKKIAVPVLIVGAIVLTGGAAIGALPALGSVLGSIGITGGMASVLGGAISGVAMGAATGAISSLITGAPLMKSIKSGALMGGITGGIGGALGMVSPNGILSDMGVGSKVSHLEGLVASKAASPAQIAELAQIRGGTTATPTSASAPAADLSTRPLQSVDPGASNSVGEFTKAPTVSAPGTGQIGSVADVVPGAPQVNAVPGVSASTGNVAVPTPPAPAPAAPAAGGGFWNSPGAMMMGGQVINGIGGALTAAGAAKEAKADRASYDVDYQGLSPYAPTGAVNPDRPTVAEKYPTATAYRYDPASGRIVPR